MFATSLKSGIDNITNGIGRAVSISFSIFELIETVAIVYLIHYGFTQGVLNIVDYWFLISITVIGKALFVYSMLKTYADGERFLSDNLMGFSLLETVLGIFFVLISGSIFLTPILTHYHEYVIPSFLALVYVVMRGWVGTLISEGV